MKLLKEKLPSPMCYIALSMAVTLFVYGLYILGPLYRPEDTAALGILSQTWVSCLTGSIYIIPSILTVAGLWTRRKSILLSGILGMSLAYLFSLLLRLLTIGFTPAIWLFYLCLFLVSVVCYLFVWGGNDS